MKVSIIEDIDEFLALEPEWNALLIKSSADSLFLTWEWIGSWLEIYQDNIKLFVIVVRNDNDELVGLAPFYFANYKFLYLIKRRFLRVLGDKDCGAEYLDWIVSKNQETEVCGTIAKTLLQNKQRWDAIWLSNMKGWNGADKRMSSACKKHGLLVNKRQIPFGSIKLPASYQGYEAQLSSNQRSQLRRQRKKIFALQGVSVEYCESIDDLQYYLEILFELHHKRRMLLGDKGTFMRKPDQIRFYRSFAKKALENNWLSICILKTNEGVKAIQLGYNYNKVFHQLQEGFEPDFLPGAGNVLRAENIKTCIEAGFDEYDFLGGFTEHKRRWLALERFGYDLFISYPNIINSLIFKYKIWPTGRFLRPAE